jgi:hypothetical protein
MKYGDGLDVVQVEDWRSSLGAAEKRLKYLVTSPSHVHLPYLVQDFKTVLYYLDVGNG